MGWKLDLKLRGALIAPATFYSAGLPAADTVLIDGPATFRSGAVGVRPPRSVVEAVIKALPPTADVAVFFDCPAMVPATRNAVHSARAAGSTSTEVAAETLAALTPASLGKHPSGSDVTWPELFSTPRGKAAAYAVLFAAAKEAIIRGCTKQRSATVTCPATGAVWSHPFGAPSAFEPVMARFSYGEAECQLAMCLRDLARARPAAKSLVLTIDTDILLQVAATPAVASDAVTIALARVWRNGDAGTVVRTSGAGRKRQKAEKLTQQWELVDCGKLPPGSAERLFWYLAAGGVDYCSGLGGFGWTQDRCLRALDSPGGAPPLFSRPAPAGAGAGGDWTFDVKALARHLAGTRRARRREADAEAFCHELDSILYCWRYYMWHDARRPGRAGPLLEPLVPRHRAASVGAWLSAAAAATPAPAALPEAWPED